MSKELGLSVAAGLASAVLFLSVLTGNPLGLLTTYLSPFPLFAIGLGLGLVPVLIGGAAAAAAVTLATQIATLPTFLVAVVLPAVVVVRQALLWRRTDDGKVEWYPPGLLLGWLAAMAAGLLFLGAAMAPDHPDGLAGAVREYLEGGVVVLSPDLPPDVRDQIMAFWVPFFPAMAAGSWLVMAVVNATAAQAALARTGHAQRPSPSYVGLELPDWLAAATAASLVAAMLADGSFGYLARNTAALLLVTYVFYGLAGIHGRLRRQGNGGLLVALFYGAFFLMFGWAVLAVAGLGLVRHFVALHRRIAGGRQEEK